MWVWVWNYGKTVDWLGWWRGKLISDQLPYKIIFNSRKICKHCQFVWWKKGRIRGERGIEKPKLILVFEGVVKDESIFMWRDYEYSERQRKNKLPVHKSVIERKKNVWLNIGIKKSNAIIGEPKL